MLKNTNLFVKNNDFKFNYNQLNLKFCMMSTNVYNFDYNLYKSNYNNDN